MMKEPMKSMLTKRPITPIDNIDLLPGFSQNISQFGNNHLADGWGGGEIVFNTDFTSSKKSSKFTENQW
jgi:hypothetical protein